MRIFVVIFAKQLGQRVAVRFIDVLKKTIRIRNLIQSRVGLVVSIVVKAEEGI